MKRRKPERLTFTSRLGTATTPRTSHQAQSFLDIIEMVCDWWGAGKGYDDPRPWMDSVALNIAQQGQVFDARTALARKRSRGISRQRSFPTDDKLSESGTPSAKAWRCQMRRVACAPQRLSDALLAGPLTPAAPGKPGTEPNLRGIRPSDVPQPDQKVQAMPGV